MKKLIIILGCILLIPLAVYAFTSSVSSGKQTADAVIYAGECYLTAVQIATNGADDITLTLADHATDASGVSKFQMIIPGSDGYGGRNFPFPVHFENGIYADVSGTTPVYFIEYIKK